MVDRRARNREDLPHVFGERLTKAFGIGRHRPPLIPLNSISLPKRLALMGYADDSQGMAICSQDRRNDRHSLAGLGEGKQGVRRAALEHNIWLDVGETAGGIEQSADRVPRVQQQQRIRRQAADIDYPGLAKLERSSAGGQNLIRRQYQALEARIARIVSDADINLAALQHGSLIATK